MPGGANLLATTTRVKRSDGTSNRPLPRLVRRASSEEGNAATSQYYRPSPQATRIPPLDCAINGYRVMAENGTEP